MSNLSYGKAGDASLGTKKEIWAARSGEIREIPILLRERHLVPMVKKRFGISRPRDKDKRPRDKEEI